MSQDSIDFKRLMQRIADGSEDAAWQLVSDYARHIERMIRRTRRTGLRSRVDTVDYAQAVWASFFRDRERFGEFENEDHLIRYLAGIAKNKVLQETRRGYAAGKRDVRRETSFDGEGESNVHRVASGTGSPSQWAIARERWDTIVGERSPQHRRIIRMRMSGATYEEIGAALGINERTARRVIDALATEMEQ